MYYAFIINHNTPYTLSCPPGVTVYADSGACNAIVNYNLAASNACSQARLIQVDTTGKTSGDLFPLGTTLQHYRIVSTFNDRDTTCAFNVTVLDSVPPRISCPSDTVLRSINTGCGNYFSYQVQAFDACPLDTIQQIDTSGLGSGDFFPVGTTTQQWMASDSSGNTDSCSFTVTVEDRTRPVARCPRTIIRTLTDT
ncbi:MAG: HYR domain-containing protein [Bacteroidia bacterium]